MHTTRLHEYQQRSPFVSWWIRGLLQGLIHQEYSTELKYFLYLPEFHIQPAPFPTKVRGKSLISVFEDSHLLFLCSFHRRNFTSNSNNKKS